MKLLILILCCFSSCVYAFGKVIYLSVYDDKVVFELDNAKDATVPICVSNEKSNLWEVSISTPQGKANHLALITAASSKLKVVVNSANSCLPASDIELVHSITLIAED